MDQQSAFASKVTCCARSQRAGHIQEAFEVMQGT